MADAQTPEDRAEELMHTSIGLLLQPRSDLATGQAEWLDAQGEIARVIREATAATHARCLAALRAERRLATEQAQAAEGEARRRLELVAYGLDRAVEVVEREGGHAP